MVTSRKHCDLSRSRTSRSWLSHATRRSYGALGCMLEVRRGAMPVSCPTCHHKSLASSAMSMETPVFMEMYESQGMQGTSI